MDFERGALGDLLNEKGVRAAAEAYTRIRVRVPEAYLLLGPFETTRPGLLVLDADGRRAASIDLAGVTLGKTKPAEIAQALRDAQKAPVTERYVFTSTLPILQEFKKRLEKRRGVVRAAFDSDGRLALRTEAGRFDPEWLKTMATLTGLDVDLVEPVPVRVKSGPKADAKALGRLAGLRHRAKADALRLWVEPVLLDPGAIEGTGHEPDVTAHRFAFFKISKGAGAVRVLRAALAVEGVLTVVPDVFEDAAIVVGRKGLLDAKRVGAAFEGAGAELEDPEDAPEDTDAGGGKK